MQPTHASPTWTPVLYRADSSEDQKALAGLRETGKIQEEHDTLEDQLLELLVTRNPAIQQNPALIAEALQAYGGGRDWAEMGCWVYYPWRQCLVHLLPEDEFVELRTNRNRNRITRQEQVTLASKTVGIVGLSVGSSFAIALAMERSCSTLRLSDFDTLQLSNMNRIRTGVYSLGLPKGVITAREIAEIDPFLRVELSLDGLRSEQADAFFDGLDLVCDACDEVRTKALIRHIAKSRGIPVIMETSDRGMLDVERYDTPEEIPDGYLHGRIDEANLFAMRHASGWDQAYLDLFVDLEQASTRGVQSLQEVGQSLVGWPQLYSDVASGGAFAAQATRKILLGQSMPDDRYYLALDEHIVESLH